MRKLKLDELGRMSPDEYRKSDKNPIIVVLDNVRSMLNVGAVFRSCDAFRVEKMYLCGYTPRPPHRDITKTAIGAENTVEWEHRQEVRTLIGELQEKGYACWAVEQTEASTKLPDFKRVSGKKYALILGNEVEGVQQDVVNQCQGALEIPQYGSKHSLNISVAAGIVIYGVLHAKMEV